MGSKKREDRRDCTIWPYKLVRIWEKILSNPLRTWIARDFPYRTSTKRYLETLVKMRLIEKVDTYYGARSKSRFRIVGYRMTLFSLAHKEVFDEVKRKNRRSNGKAVLSVSS